MTADVALVLVAVVSAANVVWSAAVWWRLRSLRHEGVLLEEASRGLDVAVERAREMLEALRAELVASERAVELRSREARARCAELARLLDAARRLDRARPPHGPRARVVDDRVSAGTEAAPRQCEPPADERPVGPAAAPREEAGAVSREQASPAASGRERAAPQAAEDILRALAGVR